MIPRRRKRRNWPPEPPDDLLVRDIQTERRRLNVIAKAMAGAECDAHIASCQRELSETLQRLEELEGRRDG